MAPDITPEVLAYEVDRFTRFLNSTPNAVIEAHPGEMSIKEARGWLRRATRSYPGPTSLTLGPELH
jgi:hypothetical protein